MTDRGRQRFFQSESLERPQSEGRPLLPDLLTSVPPAHAGRARRSLYCAGRVTYVSWFSLYVAFVHHIAASLRRPRPASRAADNRSLARGLALRSRSSTAEQQRGPPFYSHPAPVQVLNGEHLARRSPLTCPWVSSIRSRSETRFSVGAPEPQGKATTIKVDRLTTSPPPAHARTVCSGPPYQTALSASRQMPSGTPPSRSAQTRRPRDRVGPDVERRDRRRTTRR